MLSTIYTAIKDLFNYLSPRTSVSWKVEVQKNKLIVTNTSKKSAYNVIIDCDENLFWTLSYQPQAIDSGSKVEIKYTRITASNRTGYVYIKWTNRKGKKEYEYRHQLNFS